MDWQNELPAIQPSSLGHDERERIDDAVCSLLHHYGPDGHIDGHEEITAYICGLIQAERDAKT